MARKKNDTRKIPCSSRVQLTMIRRSTAAVGPSRRVVMVPLAVVAGARRVVSRSVWHGDESRCSVVLLLLCVKK